MVEILGEATIILKDGLGTIHGEIVGSRRTDFGDFLVLASAGRFSPHGEIIDNQVAVGKVESVCLGQDWLEFETNWLGSVQWLGALEAVESTDRPEPGLEADLSPTNADEVPATAEDPDGPPDDVEASENPSGPTAIGDPEDWQPEEDGSDAASLTVKKAPRAKRMA